MSHAVLNVEDEMARQIICLWWGTPSSVDVLAGLCFFNHVKCFSWALLRPQPNAFLANGNPNEMPLRVKWLSFTGAERGLETFGGVWGGSRRFTVFSGLPECIHTADKFIFLQAVRLIAWDYGYRLENIFTITSDQSFEYPSLRLLTG